MNATADTAALQGLVDTLRQQAAQAEHRRLLVLSGGRDWVLQHTWDVARQWHPDQVIWIGDAAPEGIRGRSGRDVLRILGTESEILVVNAWSGFDPDAFGAATGMVTAGGLVVLAVPPLGDWPDYPDPELRRISIDGALPSELGNRFIRRMVAVLEQDSYAVLVREGQKLPEPRPSRPGTKEPPPPGPSRTRDQAEAVDAILQVVSGHRRRPLVLTADRGRGKSAALGLAVARLTAQGETNILVTAPERAALETVFQHAGESSSLQYLPPDKLLSERPAARLLLVDEAAGFPVSRLTELVRIYPRVVFSSTVHGYEGTGRGFALRFRDRLDNLAPGGKLLHLETPIRWAPADPVEQFTFRALLLDAATAQLPDQPAIDTVSVKVLDRDWLLEHPQELEQLFGLLVQAHYRTRPLDLRNLIDGPRLTIHAAYLGEALVGAVLSVKEGGFDPATADAIWAGIRRPHGHLLAQSLAAHVGLRRASAMTMRRIMRIAVHPRCQRQGIGTRLVQAVAAQTQAAGEQILGASFGATPALLEFWQRCGMKAVRVGSRRDPASGTHSVLMISAMDDAARDLQDEARDRFSRDLAAQLLEPLRQLEPAMAKMLLSGLPAVPTPGRRAWEDAATFAWGRRDYTVCLSSLRSVGWWGLIIPDASERLDEVQKQLLLQRVLQGWNWQEVADAAGLPGRAGVLEMLREAVGIVTRAGAPPDLLADPLFRDS